MRPKKIKTKILFYLMQISLFNQACHVDVVATAALLCFRRSNSAASKTCSASSSAIIIDLLSKFLIEYYYVFLNGEWKT